MSDEVTIDGMRVLGFSPIVLKGEKGSPGVLTLEAGVPVPPGTDSGTIILRRVDDALQAGVLVLNVGEAVPSGTPPNTVILRR